MSQTNITFRMAAYSDPAGKYSPDHPLRGNEDNFIVDADLTDGMTGSFTADATLNLGSLGCLMVVADGMGGMNAGEVASEIAVGTVRDLFGHGKITGEIAASADTRRRYMESVIKEADRRVKADAASNSEHAEMGSTMIMVWILGTEMTVTWIGDSRAYRYNPVNGIEMLSEDHSYVQDLVKKGILTYEQTFDHPQGNIVTRSLGDPTGPARPESRQFTINTGDIIIVCSDGLSGVLRDCRTLDENGIPYPGENIQSIVAAHQDSMTTCREALWKAAEEAGWYDNVTVILCQILSGAPVAVSKTTAPVTPPPVKESSTAAQPPRPPQAPQVSVVTPSPVAANPVPTPASKKWNSGKGNSRTLIYASIGIVFIIAAILFILFSGSGESDDTAVVPLDQLKEQTETQIAGVAAEDKSKPAREQATTTPQKKENAESTQGSAPAGNPGVDAAMKVQWKREALNMLKPATTIPEWSNDINALINKIVKANKPGDLVADAVGWNMHYNYLNQVRELKKQVADYPVLVTECQTIEKEILGAKPSSALNKKVAKRIGEITASYEKTRNSSLAGKLNEVK